MFTAILINLAKKRNNLSHLLAKKTKVLPFKGLCGSQNTQNMIRKGQTLCWAMNDEIKTAIWLTLVTKCTLLHIFWSKTAIWHSKGPCKTQMNILGSKRVPFSTKGSTHLLSNRKTKFG